MSIKKKVYQYDYNGNYLRSFGSVTEAGKSIGEKNHRSGIAKSCNHNTIHCGFYWSFQNRPHFFNFINKVETGSPQLPNILIFDIETTPIKCYTWGLYNQDILTDNIIQDWYVLGWAAKWLFDTEILSDILTPEEALKCNDKRILKNIWTLLDKADIVIAHNGDKFDIRKLNSRFLFWEFIKPSPYQSIDTLKVTRAVFGNTSNRLDYLGKTLLDKRKIESGMKLWRECMNGCESALKYMNKYNIQDILLLEEYYLKIRGWIKSHPALGLHIEEGLLRCNTCLGDKFNFAGYYTTPANRFRVMRCLNCGGLGRLRKSEVTKKIKEQSLISVAK